MKHSISDVSRLIQAIDAPLGRGSPVHVLVLDLPHWTLARAPGTDAEQTSMEVLEKLRQAHGSATVQLGLQVPLVDLQLAELPFLFETRLTALEVPNLRRLKADLLDRGDAVVSKILRHEKRDLNAIESLGQRSGLSYESLVNSFCAIDTSSVSDMRRVKSEFLQLIESLFGANSVSQAEAAIAERLG